MKNISSEKCRSFAIVVLVLFVFSTYASAASYDATLDLGDGSGSVGGTVSLPLTLTTTGGEVGGVAFTLAYDTTKLSFQGIEEVDAAGGQDAVDPVVEQYCSSSSCSDPFDGGLPKTALFFQANDDGNGKALVAAAAAQPVSSGVLFNAKFKLLVNEDADYTVTVSQTNLPRNDSAGYTSDTSNLITVVSGIPSLTADGEGDFPVGDTFVTAFDDGTISNGSIPNGDTDGDGYTDAEENANGSDPNDINSIPAFIPQDFNLDGVIDIKDLTDLSQLWGSTDDSPAWNPKFNLNKEPVGGKQLIDIKDLTDLAQQWGVSK